MNKKFQEIAWHDTELLRVSIDRSNPGSHDVVEFDCSNDAEGFFSVVFFDVWHAQFSWNFRVVCLETIRTAICHDKHAELEKLKSQWGPLGIDLVEMKYYEFETNSTASPLSIVAKGARFNSGK